MLHSMCERSPGQLVQDRTTVLDLVINPAASMSFKQNESCDDHTRLECVRLGST